MNEDFLRKLGQAQGTVDPEPPTAQRSTTNVQTERPPQAAPAYQELSDSPEEARVFAHIARAAGNPNVREEPPQLLPVRAMYSSGPFGKATMYGIDNPDIATAELAHGLQEARDTPPQKFGDRLKASVELARDVVENPLRVLRGQRPTGLGVVSRYDRKGAHEHEAHKKIEPQLDEMRETAKTRALLASYSEPRGKQSLRKGLAAQIGDDTQDIIRYGQRRLGEMTKMGLTRDTTRQDPQFAYLRQVGNTEAVDTLGVNKMVQTALPRDKRIDLAAENMAKFIDKEAVDEFDPYALPYRLAQQY